MFSCLFFGGVVGVVWFSGMVCEVCSDNDQNEIFFDYSLFRSSDVADYSLVRG
jgi:hypothetical protein